MRGRLHWVLGVFVAGALMSLAVTQLAVASPSEYRFSIRGIRGIADENYQPVVSSEPIDLDEAPLRVILEAHGAGCNLTFLPAGQVYTLVSTSGGLSGNFTVGSSGEALPDGGEIPLGQMGHDSRSGVSAVMGIRLPRERRNPDCHRDRGRSIVNANV